MKFLHVHRYGTDKLLISSELQFSWILAPSIAAYVEKTESEVDFPSSPRVVYEISLGAVYK